MGRHKRRGHHPRLVLDTPLGSALSADEKEFFVERRGIQDLREELDAVMSVIEASGMHEASLLTVQAVYLHRRKDERTLFQEEYKIHF